MRCGSGHGVYSVGSTSTAGSLHGRFGRSILSRHKTLSIGKYCAGSGFGAPGTGGAVMVIPEYAVVTGGFGTSNCPMRAAADSHSHSGLVERPNILDATP